MEAGPPGRASSEGTERLLLARVKRGGMRRGGGVGGTGGRKEMGVPSPLGLMMMSLFSVGVSPWEESLVDEESIEAMSSLEAWKEC